MNGLSIVLTNMTVPDYRDPVDLIEGCVFRRASPEEVTLIRQYLGRFTANISGYEMPPRYEVQYIPREEGNSTKYDRKQLPENQWKYWVVSFEGSNEVIHATIQPALALNDPEIEVGMTVTYNVFDNILCPGVLYNSGIIAKLSQSNFEFGEPQIRMADIHRIAAYCSHIRALPRDSFVRHALKILCDVQRLPVATDLGVLGYFSVLEAMITHKPRSQETLDSVLHQIRGKFALLRKRFVRPMDYAQYFNDAGAKKLWGALYEYRSCLAHGVKADFQSGDLQLLKSKSAAWDFIKEAAKNLIILGLDDPDFLADLRKC